jgi:hypothetical protein
MRWTNERPGLLLWGGCATPTLPTTLNGCCPPLVCAVQILLASLYGFCKVQKLGNVTFREIISHYRKQPQAQQSIFRSVVIEQSNPGLQVGTAPRRGPADALSMPPCRTCIFCS